MFRSRRADRLKLLVWDGTGLVLIMKRPSGGRFTWPRPQAGPVVLSKVQFNVYLPPELVKEVKHAAIDAELSLSVFVEHVLREAMEKK